jgi:hypothetical protein
MEEFVHAARSLDDEGLPMQSTPIHPNVEDESPSSPDSTYQLLHDAAHILEQSSPITVSDDTFPPDISWEASEQNPECSIISISSTASTWTLERSLISLPCRFGCKCLDCLARRGEELSGYWASDESTLICQPPGPPCRCPECERERAEQGDFFPEDLLGNSREIENREPSVIIISSDEEKEDSLEDRRPLY